MKQVQLLPFCAIFIFLSSVCFGQNNKGGQFDFFAKSKISYPLIETGYYGRMTIFDNDVKRGHINSTYIDANGNYWFGGGWGAGMEVYANWSGTHFTNDVLNRTWTITPSLSYGKMLTDQLGIYGRAEVTFGVDKDIFKAPLVTTKDKSDLFGFGARVGFPYKIGKYSALTASLDYGHLTTDFSDGKTKDNHYGLNLQLEDFPGCSDLHCDPGTGFKLSQHRYQQGSGFIGSDTRGGFTFGSSRTNYNALPTVYKDNYTDADIDLHGSYYIIDNVALGAGLSFGHSTDKFSNSNKTNSTYFEFDPELYLNLPVSGGLRNLFFKGGGYFGSSKNETKSGPLTTTDKFSTTGFNAGIGYNAFFAEQTALRACVYYRSVTLNDKDSDDKSKQRGIAVSVGLVHSFGNY